MTVAELLARPHPLAVVGEGVYDSTGARLPIDAEQVIQMLHTRLRKLQRANRRMHGSEVPAISLRDTLEEVQE